MKILQLVNSADTGGAQTLIEALARRLGDRAQMHTVVLMGEDALSQRLADASASLTHLGLSRRSLRVDRCVAEVRRLARQHEVDVVHSHLYQADLVNILSPGRHAKVTTVHTTGMTHSDPARSRLIARVVGKVSARAFDAVVACGPAAQEYMRTQGYGSGTEVISNGVPVPGIPPAAGSRSGTVLCLSRWHPMKDHATLLDAFAILADEDPKLSLVLAGTGVGPDNDALAALIAARGLVGRVRCLGPVSDVGRLLAQADVLVISSAYGEALPMAGAEALAAGVPVVTTDVGDCATLTVDRRQLCQPGEPAALASAVRYVLTSDGKTYDTLVEESWARAAATLSIEVAVSRYLALYTRIAGAERIEAAT